MSDNEISDIENLKKLKELRDELDWESEEMLHCFVSDFILLLRINEPNELRPNLLDIFRKEEIEKIITDTILFSFQEDDSRCKIIIEYMIRTGYKDEPEADEDGKLLTHHTTPLRQEAHLIDSSSDIVFKLFKIYDRFDVNYLEEKTGTTHFHVACDFGFEEVVQKFLEHGQDPNILEKAGYSPLHLAVGSCHGSVTRLLLKYRADPNMPNDEGSTPLHMISEGIEDDDLMKLFFDVNDELNQEVQVDARDKSGDTALHLSVQCNNRNFMELLLRRRANPNVCNNKLLTPLHLICCQRQDDGGLAELFFNINDDIQQTVRINALDKLGRTPLQLAVASFLPNTVDILLNRGADLSSFVFPTSRFFGAGSYPMNLPSVNFKLRLASGALPTVERLENRGYELGRRDALTVMKFFVRHGFFEKSADLEKCYDDAKFTDPAKELLIRPGLSLYDVIRLRPAEAAKQLTYKDYYDFENNSDFWRLPKKFKQACVEHLSEKLSRGFFRRWALDSFLELTRQRLPILCCDIIIDKLRNDDLSRICEAATSRRARRIHKNV